MGFPLRLQAGVLTIRDHIDTVALSASRHKTRRLLELGPVAQLVEARDLKSDYMGFRPRFAHIFSRFAAFLELKRPYRALARRLEHARNDGAFDLGLRPIRGR